jgi:hypothetical protein
LKTVRGTQGGYFDNVGIVTRVFAEIILLFDTTTATTAMSFKLFARKYNAYRKPHNAQDKNKQSGKKNYHTTIIQNLLIAAKLGLFNYLYCPFR